MFEQVLILVAIVAAWDTARRYADAYHNRARLACVEDVAHEAMTLAEDMDAVIQAGAKEASKKYERMAELERRIDVLSKALTAQGETLIEHGRKITNFALAGSRSK